MYVHIFLPFPFSLALRSYFRIDKVKFIFQMIHRGYYYFTPYEFITSTFASSISQESEWQQVSPPFQDVSQYSGRSRKYWNLDGLDSSTDFQWFQSLFQAFQVPLLQLVSPSSSCSTVLFLVLLQDQSICQCFRFRLFSLLAHWTCKIHLVILLFVN